MSAAPPAPAPPGTYPGPAPPGDLCPLCGSPLAPEQEWCLNCGAAARTRLAAAPGWKAPLAAVAVIAALALGVIAAGLVKLAGDSGPAPAPATRTLTTAAQSTTFTPALPGAASTATTASTPSVPVVPSTTAGTGTSTVTPGAATSTNPAQTNVPPASTGTTGSTKAGKDQRGLEKK